MGDINNIDSPEFKEWVRMCEFWEGVFKGDTYDLQQLKMAMEYDNVQGAIMQVQNMLHKSSFDTAGKLFYLLKETLDRI